MLDLNGDVFKRFCEVCHIIQLPSREAREQYLEQCVSIRGQASVDELRLIVRRLWPYRNKLGDSLSVIRSGSVDSIESFFGITEKIF